MQVEVYIKDQLYKTLEVDHPEKYDVSELIKQIHTDRDAGLIPNWSPGERLPIKFVPKR